MKKLLGSLLITLCLSNLILLTGGQVNKSAFDTTEKIYTIVDIMPEFPGGQDKLMKWIAEKIKIPCKARENYISRNVYAKFVVDKSGKVRDVSLLQGIGGGCDEEVLRVLNNLPKWIPGKQDGVPVNVQYIIPVNFSR